VSSPNDFNARVIEEFRANQGRVGGPFQGSTMLLLTTTGARSGQGRTSLVMYMADGERMIIVGSNSGAGTHPGWFHNLLASPRARVEVGIEEFPVRAEVLEGDERERFWEQLIARAPGCAVAQHHPTRRIPPVALSREADQFSLDFLTKLRGYWWHRVRVGERPQLGLHVRALTAGTPGAPATKSFKVT